MHAHQRENSSAGRAQPCQGWVGSSNLLSRSKFKTSVLQVRGFLYQQSQIWLSGRVAIQRIANPWTSVRLRPQPPLFNGIEVDINQSSDAQVAKSVDAGDLKSPGGNTVPVRVWPWAPFIFKHH